MRRGYRPLALPSAAPNRPAVSRSHPDRSRSLTCAVRTFFTAIKKRPSLRVGVDAAAEAGPVRRETGLGRAPNAAFWTLRPLLTVWRSNWRTADAKLHRRGRGGDSMLTQRSVACEEHSIPACYCWLSNDELVSDTRSPGEPVGGIGVHGLSGSVAGCRCALCSTEQRTHEHQIAQAERGRWNDANAKADQLFPPNTSLQLQAARPGQPWTAKEIAVALDPSLTVEQAAAVLGRTTSAVTNQRHKQGVVLGRRKWSQEEIAMLADDSVTTTELARRLGRTPDAVRLARKHHHGGSTGRRPKQ